MKIRSITPADFNQWLPLWEGYNSFYKRKIPIEQTKLTWQRFLDSKELMYALVAEDDGILLGFTHYLFHRTTATKDHTCYLQDLFTLETARGRGIGKALIEAVYTKAKENGSIRVYWQTQDNNTTAKKLYDQVAEYSGFVVYRKNL